MTFLDNVEELFKAFNRRDVKYMIIGGVAVNIHGYTRATGDLDIWYNPSEQNYRQLLLAIHDFGFDTSGLENASNIRETGFIRLPIDPFHVELMSLIDGKLNFEDAHAKSFDFQINQTKVKVIGYDELIQNKIMSRRAKDLEDIAQLEKRKARE